MHFTFEVTKAPKESYLCDFQPLATPPEETLDRLAPSFTSQKLLTTLK